MSNLILQIDATFLIPTLEVYKQYFDEKYPSTDESNDGTNMSVEDEIKYGTYTYLLNTYEKSKEIYKAEYEKMKLKVAKIKVKKYNLKHIP